MNKVIYLRLVLQQNGRAEAAQECDQTGEKVLTNEAG